MLDFRDEVGVVPLTYDEIIGTANGSIHVNQAEGGAILYMVIALP